MRGHFKGHSAYFLFAAFIGAIILLMTSSSFKNEDQFKPLQITFRNVFPRSNLDIADRRFNPMKDVTVYRRQHAIPFPKMVAKRVVETDTGPSKQSKLIFPRFPRAVPNIYLNDIPVSEYKNPLPAFLHNPKSGGTTIKKCLVTMAEDDNLTITPFLWKESRLVFEEDLLNGLYEGKTFDLVAGDVSLGTCQRMPTHRTCAYYTVVREPYDRAISQYFFCKGGGETANSCENKTIEEYVVNVGSLFLRQLTYQTTCQRSKRVEDSDRSWRCVKKRRSNLSDRDQQRLLNHLLQRIDSIFAVIGITEEYEQSLELFQDAFNLSFYDTCNGYKYNVGSVDSQSKETLKREKLEAKRTLMANPEIKKSLQPDVLLYEKAKEIFQKQKELYLRKKKKSI